MTAPVITLPWDVLMHENHRLMPARFGAKSRNILSPRYRESLAAASTLTLGQWRSLPTFKDSIAVTVTLYEPDKRRRDIANYAKLILDALTSIVYVDDSQIDDLRLVRGGLDRAQPRAEITITPLAQEAA